MSDRAQRRPQQQLQPTVAFAAHTANDEGLDDRADIEALRPQAIDDLEGAIGVLAGLHVDAEDAVRCSGRDDLHERIGGGCEEHSRHLHRHHPGAMP
jgi:hypothetical protein